MSSSSRSAKHSDNHIEHSSDSKTDKDSKIEGNEESKSLELKESKGSKKRKSASRTPTPVTTVVSSEVINSNTANSNNECSLVDSSDKKDLVLDSEEIVDRAKKVSD